MSCFPQPHPKAASTFCPLGFKFSLRSNSSISPKAAITAQRQKLQGVTHFYPSTITPRSNTTQCVIQVFGSLQPIRVFEEGGPEIESQIIGDGLYFVFYAPGNFDVVYSNDVIVFGSGAPGYSYIRSVQENISKHFLLQTAQIKVPSQIKQMGKSKGAIKTISIGIVNP